ncbi:MAG: flippase, partial [Taibaiella sp.]|nr:flippase [Taibaiella sp.]
STGLTGIVYGLTGLGLQGILTREVAQNRDAASRYLGSSLAIRAVVSLPACVVLSYAIGFILGFRSETLSLIVLASVFISLSGFVSIFYSLFQAIGNFGDQFRFISVYKILCLLGCIILIKSGYGLFSILMLFSCLQVVNGCLCAARVTRHICPIRLNFDLDFWQKFIKNSFPLSLASTVEFINLKSDAVILGSFKGEAVAGIYNGAYNVYLGAVAVPTAFSAAFYPTFSRVYSTSKQRATRLFRTVFLFTAVCSGLFAFALVWFAKDLVSWIYGQEFVSSALPLIILSCGLPFIILNGLNSCVLISLGRQKLMFYFTSAGALFNVIANIILIPRYSYIGASITTIITEGVVFFAGIGIVYRLLRKDHQEKSSK